MQSVDLARGASHLLERRRLITLITSGLLAAPLAAEAQQAGKMTRVGWLSPFVDPRPTFRQAMSELGYVEGKTVAFVIRTADGRYDRIPDLAAELVSAKVDIIVAVAPTAVRAAKQATSKIPIVMAWWGGPDLVESGVIASFARPGGNVTGVHMLTSALDPKRLELLLQAVPAAKKVAVLAQGSLALSEPQLVGLRKVAPGLGVQLHVFVVGDTQGYEAAFDSMARAGVEALLVPTSPQFTRDRKSIIELAARRRIPAIYEWSAFAGEGGLMGYGPSRAEMDRQAAKLVDKILKGAKPGDLPIEQPTKFDLVINLKTAKAIGLTIPQSLLARADEVIQ
jgi:putative ABC transport system substrate-binding protein